MKSRLTWKAVVRWKNSDQRVGLLCPGLLPSCSVSYTFIVCLLAPFLACILLPVIWHGVQGVGLSLESCILHVHSLSCYFKLVFDTKRSNERIIVSPCSVSLYHHVTLIVPKKAPHHLPRHDDFKSQTMPFAQVGFLKTSDRRIY